MKITWIALVASVLALGGAPGARADEYGYLAELDMAGIHPEGTDGYSMVLLGRALCNGLARGKTVFDLARELTEPPSPLTLNEAGKIIYASVDQLCRDYKAIAIEQVMPTI